MVLIKTQKQRTQPQGAERPTPEARPSAAATAPWLPLLVVGAALATIGFIDAVLVWIPSNLGNAEWEFGTITRTFNGLALATLGIATVAVSAAGTARRKTLAVMGLVCTFVALLVLSALLLYALVVPVAWRGAPEAVRQSLGLAIAKTTAYAVIYLALYSWLAVYTWRQFRRLSPRRTV